MGSCLRKMSAFLKIGMGPFLIPKGFPFVSLWFSLGFPLVSLGFPFHFPWLSLWFPFPLSFWFPLGFFISLGFPFGFPWVSLSFPLGFPLVSFSIVLLVSLPCRISQTSPWVSFGFPYEYHPPTGWVRRMRGGSTLNSATLRDFMEGKGQWQAEGRGRDPRSCMCQSWEHPCILWKDRQAHRWVITLEPTVPGELSLARSRMGNFRRNTQVRSSHKAGWWEKQLPKIGGSSPG